MKARLVNGREDVEFPVSNGVKRGCDLVPTLFGFLFSMMLPSSFKSSDPGVEITYRSDGGIVNINRSKANTKITKATI